MTEKETSNKVNIAYHANSQFEDIVQQGLKFGGIHLNASKGHGKTRLLFSMADYIRKLPSTKVIIFDGSDSWLFGYSKIPTFNICEGDITAKAQKDILEVEQYSFNNWEMVKLALQNNRDLLFRLKTKRPSKRGYAVRQIVNYIDDLQRTEKETSSNHEPKQTLAFFVEEFQDVFNNRSTMRSDSETFLTTFNESRNQKIAFFTCSQRENDCSKTLRTKQIMAYGKIPESDKSAYHRKLEKMYKVNFSTLPQKHGLLKVKP